MSASFVVRKAGICSTVQDLGRAGLRAYGVPKSGALDVVALKLANTLVGNGERASAIEMLYSGVAVEMRGGAARIALCGAEATIVRAGGGDEAVSQWQTIIVRKGDLLRVGSIRQSAAAYLAVEGGLDVSPVLGSASTYLRGALGGCAGRAFRSGDVLPLVRDAPSSGRKRRYADPPQLRAPPTLRVMPGPQAERFEPASFDALFASEYTVSPASDRSGLRLEGTVLRHVGGYDLSSEGVATGSIQVPGSGLPVILIGDHPTVGGYPKIATIISADIPAAGRLRIGSRLRFAAVDEDEAKRARDDAARLYARLTADIVEVRN